MSKLKTGSITGTLTKRVANTRTINALERQYRIYTAELRRRIHKALQKRGFNCKPWLSRFAFLQRKSRHFRIKRLCGVQSSSLFSGLR
jgi:hypothetical protein